MATPTFVLNSTITFYGVQANWENVIKRTNADGTMDFQNYAKHVWEIPQMEIATFLSLQALQGKRFTSLTTTGITDRNNGATYTTGEVSIVSGEQVGRRAVNVRVEFRVNY